MQATEQVRKILASYESDNPGTKANLARILMQGKLGGTGKLRDPAGRSGLRARAGAQLRAQSAGLRSALSFPARDRRRAVTPTPRPWASSRPAPTHLPVPSRRSSRSIPPTAWRAPRKAPSQAVTAGVKDALRLGCSAIGFTIYPGSDAAYEMIEEIAEYGRAKPRRTGSRWSSGPIRAAAACPRQGETAIDICAYAAHIAALLGAHIIKVKPPTDFLELEAAKKVYLERRRSTSRRRRAHPPRRAVLLQRPAHRRLLRRRGQGRRGRLRTRRAPIRDGGGNGSIIGRNTFQRPREEALKLLDTIIHIYRGEA